MKKIGLLALCAALPFSAMWWGCKEDELPNVETIRVERVEIDESLKSDMELTEGEIFSISELFTILPSNATNKTPSYGSSDPDVATIDESGRITAILEGTTTISVMVDTRWDSFTLTVNPPVIIDVESVEFTSEIGENQKLAVGKTLALSAQVTVLPEDATDKTLRFESSEPTVATVNNNGLVTALAPGTTTITVTAGDKSDSFELTVIIERNLALSISSVTVPVGATDRIWDKVDITPAPATLRVKNIKFASLNESIATVDEYGVIIGVTPGETKITVTDEYDADNKKELDVKVVNVEYYKRNATEGAATPWTMSFSHSIAGTGNGNSASAALDGAYGSTGAPSEASSLTMTRPGKNYGGVNLSSYSGSIWFTVDMKEPKVVNTFKIIHRSAPTTNRTVRYFGFDEIAGSDDGTTFTPIATMIEVADAESPLMLSISETTFENSTPYRYIRFTAQTVSFCFIHGISTLTAGLTSDENNYKFPGIHQTLNANRESEGGAAQAHPDNNGNTVQMQELYLGAIME